MFVTCFIPAVGYQSSWYVTVSNDKLLNLAADVLVLHGTDFSDNASPPPPPDSIQTVGLTICPTY